MISNYNLSCDYHNFELKDKIYLIPQWALKVIYTDGFNEVVFSGNSANVTILEGYDISFQEETSFDERFKFSKSVSIKVNGYKTFNDLNYRYCVVLETKEGEFYLVNVDFPSFVTHTYTLNNGTNSTELVFSSQSNIATLKLTNFEPNNVNTCNEYSTPKVKKIKLTEAWASYLSTWQKSLVNKGSFSDIEPLPDSISLTEEFDGEKYTVTLGFDIPMSHFKNDWHIKLLQFEENKYRGYISLEDGNKAFVGYNVGLFPSYAINGDIISIRLTETAIRGIAYGNDYAIIDTNIPSSIEFSGATCKNYNFESSCDWNVESKPNYITITPMSGNADTQYTLQICNTDDETGYAVSEFVIKSCNAVVRPEVVIKNPIYRYTATTETVCSETTNERWVESGTTCTGTHGVDKWANSVKLVSYDDGETWYNSGVESATTLIEANSPDCGYRTRSVSSTTCDNGDKYRVDLNQVSYNSGLTWITTSSSSTLIERDSQDCLCYERWVESDSVCLGYDKYTNIVKQTSCDSGSSWENTDITTLFEYNSRDCGYLGISSMYKLTLTGSTSSTTRSCTSSIHTIYRSYTSAYTASCRTIQIGNCTTAVGDNAFQDFRWVTGMSIGDNVTSIGYMAFYDMYALKSVTIPSAVTSIDTAAFYDCSGLTYIKCEGTTPPTLGNNVFFRTNNCPIFVPCESVENYKLVWNQYADRIQCITPGPLPTINGKFKLTLSTSSTTSAACDSTSSITRSEIGSASGTCKFAEIGNCVTNIDNAAFYHNSNLIALTIPNSVTRIGQGAFQDCSKIVILRLPESITYIGQFAFDGCSFKYFEILATTPPTLQSWTAFENTGTCPIYVPSGSVAAYKVADGWSTYADRIQAIP